jgi:metal-responsive CopG/Arc/MetJ family transcriptional regulator
MKKTLYSLMLDEEVVREVDALAHRLGTNRSNLINQILAEYVNYTTPERRINDIFTAMERLISPSRELVPFFPPTA